MAEDTKQLEYRISQLETKLRQVAGVGGMISTTERLENFSSGSCTNNCTAACTIGCTKGCTGTCAAESAEATLGQPQPAVMRSPTMSEREAVDTFNKLVGR